MAEILSVSITDTAGEVGLVGGQVPHVHFPTPCPIPIADQLHDVGRFCERNRPMCCGARYAVLHVGWQAKESVRNQSNRFNHYLPIGVFLASL